MTSPILSVYEHSNCVRGQGEQHWTHLSSNCSPCVAILSMSQHYGQEATGNDSAAPKGPLLLCVAYEC